ncbi:MAG TPA: NAD(P)/FAD-dependent oxidoreductase, partial [Gemmatimonadales bacterium]|nr:NAD(P)/FAD-dependent oxidoreductase [Gemmatimonadales bacterium]
HSVTYDCIVVGAGPAGLSGALMLGRCRRSVLVCDAGKPRNAQSSGLHGYLTRDGMHPAEFLRRARKDLARYSTVEFHRGEVTEARRTSGGFSVVCAGGLRLSARKLLLATGVVDEVPDIDGIRDLYGKSVHHCPYCDAWEWRDQGLAVYGRAESGMALALGLTVWSDDVVLCTDGPAGLSDEEAARLDQAGIDVREDPVVRLEGQDGLLDRVVFAEGDPLPRRALFFCSGQHPRSLLAERLGARFNAKGTVETGECEATNVPGLYVAGDASKDVQFVIVAAAEGSEAGMAINRVLLKEDLARKRNSTPRPSSRGGRTQTAAE